MDYGDFFGIYFTEFIYNELLGFMGTCGKLAGAIAAPCVVIAMTFDLDPDLPGRP